MNPGWVAIGVGLAVPVSGALVILGRLMQRIDALESSFGKLEKALMRLQGTLERLLEHVGGLR